MSCDKFQDEPLTAGDSRTVTVTVTDTDPAGVTAPVDLTGWAITATLTSTLAAVPVVITKTIGSGITVTDAAAGEFELSLLPADTSGFTSGDRLRVVIRITQGGAAYTVLRDSYLTVLP